jgi:type I restriction enzyme S subunit
MADTGPLFIRIGNLTRGSLELDMSDAARLQLPKDASEVHRTRAQANDILVSITAYIGSFAVVPEGIEEAYVSQHVALCRPRPTVHNARWIGYVLLSPIGQAHGKFSLNGGTKDGLSLDDVKNHPVLMPPPDEQDRIVEWIESESAQLNASIAAIKREIDLIREYRTRLVADVVTGKVDVRAAVAVIRDEEAAPEAAADAALGDAEAAEGEGDEDATLEPATTREGDEET